MTTFWKIFISVCVTAIIIGGGIFWIMQRQIDNLNKDNLAKLEDLNKQIASLKSTAETSTSTSTDTTTATPTTSATTDPYLYTSSKYGFTLTFNSKWGGYELVEKAPTDTTAVAYLYSCVPTTSKSWNDEKSGMFCPFAITVVNKDNRTAFEQANDPLIPTYLKSGDTYAFYYSQAQAQSEDGASVMADVKNIITTFNLK
jgi:hypothetical protein